VGGEEDVSIALVSVFLVSSGLLMVQVFLGRFSKWFHGCCLWLMLFGKPLVSIIEYQVSKLMAVKYE